MEERLYRLNKTYAIVDTLICLAAIAAFAFAAWHFGKWAINLVSLVPLGLFSQHTMVIDADIRAAKVAALAPQDDIECMKPQEEDHGYSK